MTRLSIVWSHHLIISWWVSLSLSLTCDEMDDGYVCLCLPAVKVRISHRHTNKHNTKRTATPNNLRASLFIMANSGTQISWVTRAHTQWRVINWKNWRITHSLSLSQSTWDSQQPLKIGFEQHKLSKSKLGRFRAVSASFERLRPVSSM